MHGQTSESRLSHRAGAPLGVYVRDAKDSEAWAGSLMANLGFYWEVGVAVLIFKKGMITWHDSRRVTLRASHLGRACRSSASSETKMGWVVPSHPSRTPCVVVLLSE